MIHIYYQEQLRKMIILKEQAKILDFLRDKDEQKLGPLQWVRGCLFIGCRGYPSVNKIMLFSELIVSRSIAFRHLSSSRWGMQAHYYTSDAI